MLMLFRRMGAALQKRQFGQMFYEFLLIFLAVMAGFAAENWRENLEDKKRLKQYLISMRADLQADQNEADRIVAVNRLALADIAFIVEHLYGTPNDSQLVELYTKSRFLVRKSRAITLQDRVYTQMKSAGDLRLITNETLSDPIARYYFFQTVQLAWQATNRIEIFNDLRSSQDGVFDSRVFFMLSGQTFDRKSVAEALKRLKAPVLAAGLPKYVNHLGAANGATTANTRFAETVAQNAKRLETLLTAEIEKLD